MLTVLAAALVAVLAPEPAHPGSMSTSRIIVTGAAVRLELRCQVASLIETFGPESDPNGDGFYDDAELLALRGPLEAYVREHYVLRANGGGDAAHGVVLAGELTDLGLEDPDLEAPVPMQWMDLALEHRAPEAVRDLLIDVTLFREAAPDHRDLCRLEWNGGEPREALFWAGEYRRFDAAESLPAPRPMLGWVRLGVGHILSGWDHVAFVLALIVAAGALRGLLVVVTAFTLAHSVTLALAALEVVAVPSGPVEIVIALSIAWVGLANLLARAPRARWPEAFAFGLVHGLGFAGFLAEALYGEPGHLRALVGFNLGVEAGQLVVVLGAVAVLWVLRRALRSGRAATGASGADDVSGADAGWLAPRLVRLPVSLAVVLLALFWAGQRAGAW